MSDRPEPPVPPECTTSGNGWFPFYFDRLRKSKWWRRASDTARARNVMMWGEAFKAEPAGSLPDDDDELAEAAGYGMDVDAFLSVKAEIMAPWTLCSDGRWYHPTVCEVVLDAWERSSERKKAAAERQRRRREKTRGVTIPQPKVTPQKPDVTRDIPEKQRDFDIQTVQTGQDSEDADASLSTVVDAKPEYPPDFEISWKAYPHVRGRSSKTKSHGYWRRISSARRSLLPSAIARYAREGREPNEDCGAPAMERWLRDQRYLDWLEEAGTSAVQEIPWAGPDDVRDLVRRHLPQPEYADTYLRACTWRDVPERAIVTASTTIFAKLRDCEAHLRRSGVCILLEKDQAA